MKRFGTKHRVSVPAKRTWRGKVYPSMAEMLYAQELDIALRAGKINEIIEQPTICLGPIDWRLDFAVRDADGWTWRDVKGVETAEFKIKAKLWESFGPGPLWIVKRSGKRFRVSRVVRGGRKDGPNG